MDHHCGNRSLDRVTVEHLRRGQYRQIAEWEYGPFEAPMDWERYARELEDPAWSHFAVYLDSDFCASISLESVRPDLIRFHVSKAPKTIDPFTLGDVLLRMADYCFENGIEECEAVAPPGKRAVAKLALRCGLTYRDESEDGKRYSLTREERAHATDETVRRAA